MAILENNPMMRSATGKVGPIYFRQLRGKTMISNMPARRRGFTPAQLENQRRFGEASSKTKKLLKDPAMKEKYQARTDDQKFTAHMVAQSDLMNAPKVREIDASQYKGQAGDEIVVNAIDNFKVTKVIVTVVSNEGKVIESGEAVQDVIDVINWRYKTTIGNPDPEGTKIRAKAFDTPGNVGEMEVVI